MNILTEQPLLANNRFHKIFITTVIMNGIIAILDIMAGFFFVLQPVIHPLLVTYAAHDGIIGTGTALILSMSDKVQTIGAFYFFSHGVVKFFLVWGLLRSKLWAYPVSIFFLSAFSAYQIYELLHHYSPVLTAFLLFNTIVIILVIKEYRYVVALTKLTANKLNA